MKTNNSGKLSRAALQFQPNRLTIARELNGMTKTRLAKAINVSPAAISQWENATKKPSIENIHTLCLTLGIQPEFLSATCEQLHKLDAPHFRSLRSTSQIERKRAEAFTRLVSELFSVAKDYVQIPLPNFPELTVDEISDPVLAAQRLREHWQLGLSPIANVIAVAEDNGILVIVSPNHVSSIDAFSCNSSETPLIVLNPKKNDYYRRRFDVAHELGHLLMHIDCSPGDKVQEAEADLFSSEFLAPTAAIISDLPKVINASGWRTLFTLKEKWGCSIQSLLYRSHKLDIISERQYKNAMVQVSKNGWRTNEPGQKGAPEYPTFFEDCFHYAFQYGLKATDIPVISYTPQTIIDSMKLTSTPNHSNFSSTITSLHDHIN